MWKGRMLLFLESADSYIPEIIRNGPHIPLTLLTTTPTVPPVTVAEPPRTIVKPQDQWTEEDKKLVNLDIKARSLIVMSLPNEVYYSVMLCLDTKNMWNTLCVLYEGTEEVNKIKKVNLNR